jgi:hypothetical protein
MKLTDNEKREILKLLEADKPLPDKYRFLLFDDKREVELVWNGKANEVCNIALPFQVIEQVDEPRAEKPEDSKAQGSLFDERGRQKAGGLDVPLKMARLKKWCEDINASQKKAKFDYVFVEQEDFEKYKPEKFNTPVAEKRIDAHLNCLYIVGMNNTSKLEVLPWVHRSKS